MRINQLIPREAMDKIAKWVDRPINQIEKTEKYEKLLKRYGFNQLDLGTNREIYTHEKYPKVVFKIALDEQGVLDNLNEYEKSDKSKYFPMSYDIDTDGYVLIQQRTPVMQLSTFREKEVQKRVRKILRQLDSEGFYLLDLGADKHKNFGMDKKGEIYILDFGYVGYKSLCNFNCPHTRVIKPGKQEFCKGKLDYNKSFTMLVCDECENAFKVDVAMEGYTQTMYAKPPEKEEFRPSKDLEDFYKSFNKHRDRGTLKRYVSLTKSEENRVMTPVVSTKPITEPPSAKDRFLALAGKVAAAEDSDKVQLPALDDPMDDDDEDDDDEEFDAPRTLRSQIDDDDDDEDEDEEEDEPYVDAEGDVYETAPRPILHHDEDRDVVQDNIEDGQYQKAMEYLMATGVSEKNSGEIVTALFYERFPEMKRIITDFDKEVERRVAEREAIFRLEHANANITEKEPEPVLMETIDDISVLEDLGIVVSKPSDGELQNEIHIGMSAENLKKRPIIVISKNDVVYYIDLLAHVDRLIEFKSPLFDGDMIVTSMVAEPVDEFNRDYDDRYFEND